MGNFRLTESQWAWVAGLFEGEGCIGFRETPGMRRSDVRLVVNMCDRDVLETLQGYFPGSTLRLTRRAQGKQRAQFSWTLQRKELVREFLEGVQSWLHGRRGVRAREALERLSQSFHYRDATHCKWGHPLSGDNVRVRKGDGARICLVCTRGARRQNAAVAK